MGGPEGSPGTAHLPLGPVSQLEGTVLTRHQLQVQGFSDYPHFRIS